MKQELHFEHGDLVGEISLSLPEGQSLNELFENISMIITRTEWKLMHSGF